MIGIFDSGIGGLTVVKELRRVAPDASFIYLGDTARHPYGSKSQETIVRYALEDASFLVAKGARAIVVACNTVSAVAMDALRATYPGFPLYDVITPVLDDALATTRGKVGVIGTRATIGSQIYQTRLSAARKGLTVMAKACPLLVPLVEEGWLKDQETKRILKHYLYSMRISQIDTLILGCTHYKFLAPLIQRYMGRRVHLIDSASSVVRHLLSEIDIEHRGDQRYFLTDVSPHWIEVATQWLGQRVAFEKP